MGTQKTPQKADRITCPADHKHQKTCYLEHRCGCNTCRDNARIQREYYRKQKAYGRPTTDLVDAAPAREHVNMLRAAGLGQDRIAALSGIGRNVIRHILYGTGTEGPARRIRAYNAAALLAVLPDPKDRLLRDPRGTVRRLQALAVQGWSFARLGRMLGMTGEAIHAYVESIAVTPETHERVAALFEELWNTEPPRVTKGDRISYAQTVAWARKEGWVGALAWDDIDTDDAPVAQPRNMRVAAGQRELMVRELHAQVMSDGRIASEVGVNTRTVLRIRQRLGLPAWTKEQQEAAA